MSRLTLACTQRTYNAVLHGDQLTVVVSPDVAAASLAFLSSDIALAVADAVDRNNGTAAERP